MTVRESISILETRGTMRTFELRDTLQIQEGYRGHKGRKAHKGEYGTYRHMRRQGRRGH